MPDIIELAESGSGVQSLEWFREKSASSLFFFNKVVLGYNKCSPVLHQQLCQWIVKSRPKRGRGILMPRKFYKSTNVKGYVLWLLKDNPDLRVLFVGESDKVGGKNLNDIKWHIRENRLFQALYPKIIPTDFSSNWSDSEILLPRSKSFDEPTITCIGIGAKHTGFHYDLIVYDDPIGMEAAQSKAEMDRAIEWFQAAPGLLDNPNSEELIVGTRWKDGTGDLYGWVQENLPYKESAEGSPEGFDWYIRSAIEEDKSIFPEVYPIPELEKIRKRLGPYLWAANMMNDPTIPSNTDFAPEWIHTYHVSEDHRAVEIDSTNERILLRDLVRISFYDPSAGGKSAGAENAIVVTGMDAKRRVFVLDTWSKNCGFGEAIEQWHKMNDKWMCWRNYYEAVGAHKAAEEVLRMRPLMCDICKKVHKRILPVPIRPPDRSKEDRIRAQAQPAFEEDRVFLRQGMEKLRKQIIAFPHSNLVDIFDCLAYCISLLRAPVINSDERTDREKMLAHAAGSSPRTHTSRDFGGYS